MQNSKDLTEINTVSSPIATMEKPSSTMLKPSGTMFQPDTCPHGNPRANLYSLCIGCPDWPCHCNGPSLYEFLDIMLVRNFARKIRDFEDVKNKQIADKISHVVSEATVIEFFSNKVKDFLWTTTAYIFHGLKLAVLEKRLGTGFDINLILDNPCPASSSKIQEMMAAKDLEIANLRDECQRLQTELDSCKLKRLEDKQKRELREATIKQDEQLKIDHLKGGILTLTEQCADYKATAEKRYGLIVARDYIIIGLVIACIILLILSTMYLVWDFTHDGKGIFW